ncbi:MAG: tRNA lysidine(34) synthetase TilS [Micromonosporaceae bacterium]|nr:tRNA lysidine(34) synthetase TilS [Micromonosporaceae bacterium]
MAALAPALAAVRTAVRRALRQASPQPGDLVLVACSGGADSLALAAATAFVAPRLGLRAGLVSVDHKLQPGSAERADQVVSWAASAGLVPAEAVSVTVSGYPGGPEAAARAARYEALIAAAHRLGAFAVLLGHTRDDQAETVLLALARGAGPRGMAGMPARRDVAGVALLRPLLDISREQTGQACAAAGLRPWQDPHNTDPAYARSRVRATALPALVAALGPGVVANLARSARLIAADVAALDELTPRVGDGPLPVAELAELPEALRTRTLHRWALALGAPAGSLSHRHVAALDALVVGWHGQGPVYLPGGIQVSRAGGRLVAA